MTKTHPKNTDQPELESSNGKTVAIVVLVLVIILALLGMFLMFSSRAKMLAELTDAQNQLQLSRNLNSQLQSQVETLRTANTNAQYILMNGMDVRIPKTADLQNIVVGEEITINPNQPFIHFTSTEILAAVMAHPAGPYSSNQCALGDSPLGVITRYNSGNTVFGKKIETIVDANVKKLGDYYYVYTNSASSCSSNTAVSEIVTAQQQAFAAAFANLELTTSTQK